MTVEVGVGRDIGEVCEEAIALATQLSVFVKFPFNGIHVVADPMREGDPDLDGATEYLVSTFRDKTRQHGFKPGLEIHAGYALGEWR